MGEKRTWAYPGTAQIFECPLLSQEQVKLYELKVWPRHSRGPSEQKPFKNLGENGAWSYPGTVETFSVPPIISETGKATNFKIKFFSVVCSLFIVCVSHFTARCTSALRLHVVRLYVRLSVCLSVRL